MDMELYKEVFNTVLTPPTFIVQTYFNPVLAAIPIYWPAEIMNIGQMSGVEFGYGDGFIYMGSQLSWVPFPLPYKLIAKQPVPQPTIKESHKNPKIYEQ